LVFILFHILKIFY